MEFKIKHPVKAVITLFMLVAAVIFVLILRQGQLTPNNTVVLPVNIEPANTNSADSTSDLQPITDPIVVASNLKIPWDLAFLPEGNILITERDGSLVNFDSNGQKTSIKLPRPVPKGEGGLLGIVLHPEFRDNHFLYLYMTTQNAAEGTKNAVFRYTYENGKLSNEKTIISGIPGAIYHDGGRMEFGPDGYLYITTGDATKPAIAQDLNSFGGKILRLTDDGSIPPGNPFGTEVYSYGHRNPQGLAWDDEGRLWETEHGRSGVASGMDEVNLIIKGKNYGWPDIEGDKTKSGMELPALHSGATSTWAPASALYYKGSLFFGGLKGEALYEAVLSGDHVEELKTHLLNEYGRIRTVRLGPDGMFYLTTSNRDGRGDPVEIDDRIIRIDPRTL